MSAVLPVPEKRKYIHCSIPFSFTLPTQDQSTWPVTPLYLEHKRLCSKHNTGHQCYGLIITIKTTKSEESSDNMRWQQSFVHQVKITIYHKEFYTVPLKVPSANKSLVSWYFLHKTPTTLVCVCVSLCVCVCVCVCACACVCVCVSETRMTVSVLKQDPNK